MFGLTPTERSFVQHIVAERNTTLKDLAARGFRPLREHRFDRRKPSLVGLTTGRVPNGSGGEHCVEVLPGETRHYQRMGDSFALTAIWRRGDDQF